MLLAKHKRTANAVLQPGSKASWSEFARSFFCEALKLACTGLPAEYGHANGSLARLLRPTDRLGVAQLLVLVIEMGRLISHAVTAANVVLSCTDIGVG